ncbi:MAG TPA: alpha/beta hydrolase [Candidatus Aquilonibacter sp.]|nr:alpha/beta hydrolase [Candidatus Aquilonibacter sp.]
MKESNCETANSPFPGARAGVEECWSELDGARLRYLRAGSGPPLVLLHGLLGYSFSWRFAISALAPYATIYAPDMMGAGFSDRPPGIDHSMRGTAQRLLRWMELLGISSCDLLGTSHGGAVAMMAAAESRKRALSPKVRRLVLVAPVNPFSPHGRRLAPFFGSNFGSACFRLFIPQMHFLYPYWHARMYGDRKRIPPDSLAGYLAPLAKPSLFEHALSIVRTWTEDLLDLKATLPELASIPTLLMWGGKDPAVYASSAEPLAKYFSHSPTIIFPGVGHLPYEECAEEFNRELIKFLNSDHEGASENPA